MTKVVVDIPEEIAKNFEGKKVVSYMDVITYEESHWTSIKVDEKASEVIDFLKSMKS